MKEHSYPIRVVSKLTGLSVDTLRAWERRYDAIKPTRAGRGRVYSEADIRRLNLLREAVEAGHAIGQIASLSDQRLQEIGGRVASLVALRRTSSLNSSAVSAASRPELKPLLDAIEEFDYKAADLESSRLAALMTPREMVYQIVIPLMEKVGDRWHSGEFTVAQEHMISAILRNQLGALIRVYARGAPPTTLLFATTAGEQHEFGILCAGMLAAAGGLGIVYLGPSLPAREIVETAERTSVQVVVIGLKGATSSKEPLKELQQISQTLPEGIELWVGGSTSRELTRQIKRTRALFIPDFKTLEQQLNRRGARF
ncbi:MAG TPA: MerR family transcriptional regulator [Blastocatellia bacterium]|nr:MerR family transcriptional regulator [Blastocatellia bacterium]